jgi:hypothetical protein
LALVAPLPFCKSDRPVSIYLVNQPESFLFRCRLTSLKRCSTHRMALCDGRCQVLALRRVGLPTLSHWVLRHHKQVKNKYCVLTMATYPKHQRQPWTISELGLEAPAKTYIQVHSRPLPHFSIALELRSASLIGTHHLSSTMTAAATNTLLQCAMRADGYAATLARIYHGERHLQTSPKARTGKR